MKRIWTIIGVSDVPRSFRWYQALFGQRPKRPGHRYFGQLLDSDGTVLLCLHEWGTEEHPSLMSPGKGTPGNGLLLFFRVDDFERAEQRARALVPRLEEDPHLNPNTGTNELSLRDPDGYYVTISALTPPARAPAAKTSKSKKSSPKKPVLLSGGNPQIAKGDGDAPVQAYLAAIPGWKAEVGWRLDALIERTVPKVQRAVKWNSPFYGIEGQGWFLSFHVFARYVKVTFFRGTSLRPLPPGKSKTKETRYLDIYEDGLDEKQLAIWIKQAATIPGWDGGSPRSGGVTLA